MPKVLLERKRESLNLCWKLLFNTYLSQHSSLVCFSWWSMKRCFSENELNTLNQTEKFNKSQFIDDWKHLNILMELLASMNEKIFVKYSLNVGKYSVCVHVSARLSMAVCVCMCVHVSLSICLSVSCVSPVCLVCLLSVCLSVCHSLWWPSWSRLLGDGWWGPVAMAWDSWFEMISASHRGRQTSAI